MLLRLPKFAGARNGSTTIEFIVVFVTFVALMFFVVELTVYLFFLATLEKAAEAGVRAAVTSAPVVALPLTIEPAEGARYGDNCQTGNRCVPFSTSPLSCTGDECNQGDFERILGHMQRYSGQIEANNVTIVYTYVGIGFAGGPTTPMVTVTVQGVPFQTGIADLLLNSGGGTVSLPPRSASMTGEDLAQ